MVKSFEFIDLEQRTLEWYKFRETHVMASDAPKIMGVSPYGTPLSLWEEKLGFRKTQEDNPHMKRGRDLEPEALEFYNKFTKQNLKPRVAVSTLYPFMGASFDGISDCGKYIVEIKCPTHFSDVIPERYYPQLQHQLIVSRAEVLHYMEYTNVNGYPQFRLIKTSLNEDYEKELLKKTTEFYSCLINMESPEPHKKDYIYRSDEDYYKAVSKWFIAKEERVLAEEIEEKCKAALLEEVGFKNTKGLGFVIKQKFKKGTIDYSIIPELKVLSEDKINPYRKNDTVYWKIDE